MRPIAALAILFISFNSLDCQHRRVRQLSRRLNFFDIELLRAIADKEKGNVMVSPASVKSTLAMLLAGAEGSTAKEIEDALRISSLNDEMKEQLQFYVRALKGNSTTAVLQNANAIFVSKQINLKPKYEYVVKQDYLTEVTRLDFNDPHTAAMAINSWVSENTRGLIPFVVEPVQITPPIDLIVANALYFKSNWLHAFDPHETRSSCFHRDGCKKVAMMELEEELNYSYVEDLKAHALELPYEGNRYSMIILVPLAIDGINSLMRDLPFVTLPRILEVMEPRDVTLLMPRFTVNFNVDLVDALTKTHISSLFSNKSNLSQIFEGPAHVNSFVHKVFMSVDETGTVAAASSAAMLVPLIYNGAVDVRADRPFVFFIRDKELGIVLFEGKVEEPSVLEQPPTIPSNDPVKFPEIDIRKEISTVKSERKPEAKKSIFDSVKDFFG